MSLSYSSTSVIGGKFDNGVENQLELRKSVLNKKSTRSTDDIKYLNSTTGWVRVISSVDTLDATTKKYTSEPAKKYILQGGIPDSFSGFKPSSDKSSYTKSTEYGFIPTPGITSFQVQSRGTFGTLRTASFTFTVNSPEDFSKLEQLYLRPGFSILLEWGHSYHISNTSKRLEPTTDLYPLDDFLKTKSKTDIERKIDSLKKISNSFNYDGMFGIIKNFIWNYNGYTYECQVDVVSVGEIVESVKAAMAPLTLLREESEAADTKYASTEYGSKLQAFLRIIANTQKQPGATQQVIRDKVVKDLKLRYPELTNLFLQKHSDVGKTFDITVGNLTTNYPSDNGYTKYITLRSLLILINEVSLLYTSEGKLVQFYTGGQGTINTFTTFDEHVGLDPGICILPKTTNSEFIFQPQVPLKGSSSNDILDILISVNFLIDRIKSIENKEDVNATVYDYVVSDVLGAIQDNLGNINYFDVTNDIVEGTTYMYIVDRKVIPSKQDIKTKLDLVGLASEVSNLNITSKISNNLTSMIAIAAQTDYSPSSAEDLYNIQKWNFGLRDRHIKEVTVGSNGQKIENQDIEEVDSVDLKEKLKEYIKRINGEIKGGPAIIPDPTGLKAVHRQLMSEFVREKTNTPNKTNPPGLIPFELSFTMKGISGIKVGQAFTINDFFLPERYKGRVGFIVTGVDHTVSDNRWNTDLKSQMIFI